MKPGFHHFEELVMEYPASESIDIDMARSDMMVKRHDAAGKQRVARAAKGRDVNNLQCIHGRRSRIWQHQKRFLIPVKKSGSW
jgi:hypothetical protein